MCAKQVKDGEKKVKTTGHSWDGIEEYDNPMPRWWVWTFYACIIWGLGYSIVYPSWPLISHSYRGLTNWSARTEVAEDIAKQSAFNATIQDKLVQTELTEIGNDPELAGFAQNAGRSIFINNCAQCHGAGAAGVQNLGYPNLLDDDWLWGGDIESIHTTVTHGIRNTTDEEARFSQMPAFGRDGMLDNEQIGQVVEYVLMLSGQDHDMDKATLGETIFMDNCSGCHGETGDGDRDQGAPKLNDAVWLYGGTREDITETVTNARFGVMPNWSPRLSEADIRAVAFYVHGLGGGE